MPTPLSKIKTDLAFINLAQQCGRQYLLSSTNQKAADRLLTFMLAQHGSQLLARFAGPIYQQIPAALKRLKQHNLANIDTLPDYSKDGFKKALASLPAIQRTTGSGESADFRVLVRTAFEQIDSLPAFSKFQAAAAEICARLPILQELFSARHAEAANASSATHAAHKQALEIQRALAEILPGHLLAVKDMLVESKKILPSIKDQEIIRQLTLRTKTYEGALEIFGGKSNAHLRNLLSEALRPDSTKIDSLSALFEKESFLLSTSLAAAEAVVSLASMAPPAISGVIVSPCVSSSAQELTKEARQWLDEHELDGLAGDLISGIEYFDEKTGRPQKFSITELSDSHDKQFVRDLAGALTRIGTSKALLAKALGKLGAAQFAQLLNTRGAQFVVLHIGFHRADLIIDNATAPDSTKATAQQTFVRDYFTQLSKSTYNAKESEEIVINLIQGEFDKTAPLLASLARCSLSGLSYIPKVRFIEFTAKLADLPRAGELLTMQLSNLYNDGYSLRMKEGVRFDAIDTRGRVTEFRPSAELSGYLKDYKAPDWVTNTRARAGIEQIQLGYLGESLLRPGAGQVHTQSSGTRRRQDLDFLQNVNAEWLAGTKACIPALFGTAASEFRALLREQQDRWLEDLAKDKVVLLRLESEMQDNSRVFSRAKEHYFTNEQLHTEAQQELSHQKGWFRKPLSERLTGIEQKIVEKVEAFEQNPEHPLGRAKHDFERSRQEHDALKLRLEKQSDARKLDLQKILHFMNEKHAWTPVLIDTRRDAPVAIDSYLFGKGKIVVPQEIFFSQDHLETTIFHELFHLEQDRQLVEYALHKTNGDQEAAATFYQDLTGRPLAEDFLSTLAQRKRPKSYQQADEVRLVELGTSLQSRKPILSAESEKIYERTCMLESRLYSLTRDKSGVALDHLFAHFDDEENGEEFQKRLFGGLVPAEVQLIFEQWNSKKQNKNAPDLPQEDAKRVLRQILQSELDALQQKTNEIVSIICPLDRLGMEAAIVSTTYPGGAASSTDSGRISSVSSTTSSGVTPYEALQALTAASSKKGDSLHPESKGWESTRKMYDSKLQQGQMTADQAKQILALPPDDREAMEAMLKNDSPLSKSVLSKVLQLDTRSFHNLLGVAPTICNRVLLPALERGLIDARRLEQILNLPDSQRRGAMNFIERAVKDPEHPFNGEHVERFMALPPSGRADIALALNPIDGSKPLSSSDIAVALSAPTRSASGKEFCDAATLVKAQQMNIMSADLVKDFANLDENARSGIAALLGTNALTKESANMLMQKLQTGELSEVNARDLGVARLVGWLPDGSLEHVFRLDAALRNTLFDRLAAETPRGKHGGFSVPEFLKRQAPLNDMRKQGVINEPTMRLLGTPHASDLLVFDLLRLQASKTVSERVSPESIQQLILLTRAAKMSLETLEAYRYNIERGWHDRNTLRSMLSQKPELKQAAETCMRLDPEMFVVLQKEGRFDAMAMHAERLTNPAHIVFPAMFPPDGKHVFNFPSQLPENSDTSRVLVQFIDLMNAGDFLRAMQLIEDSAAAKKIDIHFTDQEITLYDLNRQKVLQALLSGIQTHGRTSDQDSADARSKDNLIMSANPLIHICGNRMFHLRDSQKICDDGEWRESTAQEKAFIESISSGEAAKAIIGTTAMLLAESWVSAMSLDKLSRLPGATPGTGRGQLLSNSAGQAAAAAQSANGAKPPQLTKDNGAERSRIASELSSKSLLTQSTQQAQSMPNATAKAQATSQASKNSQGTESNSSVNSRHQSSISGATRGPNQAQQTSSSADTLNSAQALSSPEQLSTSPAKPIASGDTGGPSSQPLASPQANERLQKQTVQQQNTVSSDSPMATRAQAAMPAATKPLPLAQPAQAVPYSPNAQTQPQTQNIAEAPTEICNRSIATLMPDNFAGIRTKGYSEIRFASGKLAAIRMRHETFQGIEQAYDQYMTLLGAASKLEGEQREEKMRELVALFDQAYAATLTKAGIRLGNSSQPYVNPLYDIVLNNKYKSKHHTPRTPVQPFDLNTVQGLRRLLDEHVQGKRIYLELASVKKSGFTPKFDPKPASGHPAKINPQDVRKLTAQQRSAIAFSVWNDNTGLYKDMYVEPADGLLNAVLEMTVLKAGDCETRSSEAFNRAEQWAYLMMALNDQKPISHGGNLTAAHYDVGDFDELPIDKEPLVSSNDFMQTLREMDVIPDESLWYAAGQYRREVEQRLARDREDTSPAWSARARLVQEKEVQESSLPLYFERGEAVTYDDELYRVIGRYSGGDAEYALIAYDGAAREATKAALVKISQKDLDTGFEPVLPDNEIHYLSKDENDSKIYVLSTNEQGQMTLHTDASLLYVPSNDLSRVELTDKDADLEESIPLGKELWHKAREIFDNYKEYSLSVSGQPKPLPFRQVILGRGNDAGIKVVDELNYVGSRHLQILVTDKGVAIQDLNSKNGSYLNGNRMQPYETVKLRTFDRVTLGAVDGPVLALAFKPTEISKAPEYNYFVGDKMLQPGAFPFIIGRLATADAFVSDPTVSKIQATVRMTAESKVMIKDGGARPSTNGLVINGEHIAPGAEVELDPGDKVATRTGVILPIKYEKKRSRFALLVETASGRVNIKDANLAGIPVFLGVDPRHGVYALPKNNMTWLAKPTSKSMRKKTFSIKSSNTIKRRKRSSNNGNGTGVIAAQNGDTVLQQDVLYALSSASDEALKQSNQFALNHLMEEKMVDGWACVSKGKTFDSEGNFEAQNRVATVVDRKNDQVLKGVIEDGRRRFWHLSPELRARALTEYVRGLLSTPYLPPDQLDRWYNQFSHDHNGKRVLLGEYIKENKGICTQQAVLLKVLADEFGDMQCKLVRGMDGCHAWTTILIGGKEIIHDPRGRFISPVAGERGALPQSIHWVADGDSTKGEFAKQIYVKVGDAVSYDGSTGWLVSSYDTLTGDIVLSCDGNRVVASVDVALSNPGRALQVGEKYNIPRDNGLVDRGQHAWTFAGVNKDGTLKFFRIGAIDVQARIDQVRLRSERRSSG